MKVTTSGNAARVRTNPTRRTSRGVQRGMQLAAAALLTALTVGCGDIPAIVILTPTNGVFTTGSSVVVTGIVTGVADEYIQEVTVQGVSVLPLGPGNTFSTSVNLDPAEIVNPIVAELTRSDGPVHRDRVTVMLGDSIADGGFSPEGIALRINDTGLIEMEPIIEDLVDQSFDLGDLIGGPPIQVNECLASVFGLCTAWLNTIEVDNATFTGIGVAIDSMTNEVDGEFTVDNLEVNYTAEVQVAFKFDCTGRFNDTTTFIDGSYALQPDAVDPSSVDVNQTAGPFVSFSQFVHNFTGGVCDFPVIGALISAIAGDVQPVVRGALEEQLADPDGGGPLDSPIADGVEVALEGVEISGPIGEAIGVSLETPLFDVTEDVDGITLDSDARITASMPDPGAVDLAASYHVDETFPTFGPLAPNGLPYELGLCISTSAFNQLLKAEIESGLLITSISEIDFGFGPTPITGANLALILGGGFVNVDPTAQFSIDIYPTIAPIVTGELGPAGEIANMVIAQLLISVVPLSGDPEAFIQAAVDVQLGLDLSFSAGALVFALSPPEVQDVSLTVLQNPIGGNEVVLQLLVPTLMTGALDALQSSLGSFPLPAFLGLDLNLVDLDRNGEFMSLFLDLQPVP